MEEFSANTLVTQKVSGRKTLETLKLLDSRNYSFFIWVCSRWGRIYHLINKNSMILKINTFFNLYICLSYFKVKIINIR
jgi:hypothetical protein